MIMAMLPAANGKWLRILNRVSGSMETSMESPDL